MPWGVNDNSSKDADNFGNGESFGGATYGADSNGDPVTFASDNNGGTYISSGHVESPNDFWGYRSDGAKGHDHYQADGSTDFGNNHDGDRGRYP
jgi:hypothetical protein